jgi:ATP phosphoribosyltransferase
VHHVEGRHREVAGRDLVSSGATLKANNLVAVEDIMPNAATDHRRLCRGGGERETLQPILDAFAGAVEK